MQVSPDISAFAGRSKSIDYSAVDALHYLGNYVRKIPVNLDRMMENAYDWEHLPHVHATSFADIELIDEGAWGWHARVEVPPAGSDNVQMLQLLVDAPNKYWATTILSGVGEGTEIHTQATNTGNNEIEVDVRFYVPEALENEEQAAFVLQYLQNQYRILYDEDSDLMQGRQAALDRMKKRVAVQSGTAPRSPEVLVGEIAALRHDAANIIETIDGPFAVRRWQDEWIVHSATCSHLLGPLDSSSIDSDGNIKCPWHGYRFDIKSGENVDGKCKPLRSPPLLVERDGRLYLTSK